MITESAVHLIDAALRYPRRLSCAGSWQSTVNARRIDRKVRVFTAPSVGIGTPGAHASDFIFVKALVYMFVTAEVLYPAPLYVIATILKLLASEPMARAYLQALNPKNREEQNAENRPFSKESQHGEHVLSFGRRFCGGGLTRSIEIAGP